MAMKERLRVWAPRASSVDAEFDRYREPMAREREWWILERPVAAGTDYRFSVDGTPPVPDPRSPWQPEGIHGPSRTVDHSLFDWTDCHWQAKPLASGILYELHVGTFTQEGTFDAAIAKLDHLVSLGVTHVEIMPVNEFSGDYGWGYDGVDLFAPHHSYGGPHGLKRLVNACHRRGLAAVLDVVYNHFGPAGNYVNRFGPYTTDLHHTPWGAAVNLDGPQSYEVRRFICDNALMWLRDYHFDGLRIDAVHTLIDTSATHILEQLSIEVDALERQAGRYLILIAESDLNDPRIVRPRELGGYGIDAQWSDDFHHSVHALLTGEHADYYADFGGFAPLAKAIENVFVFDGVYSVHRDRLHGRSPEGIAPHRFVVCAQNHDQVGNRAAGDRSSSLMSSGRLHIAAALVLLSPYVPLLFQGEEWAASTAFQYFTDHREEWLVAAVSKGRTAEFAALGWRPEDVPDPQARETFLRSKLNWGELSQSDHASMLNWYRCLIKLRAQIAILAGEEKPRVTFDAEHGWMMVRRGAVKFCFSLGLDRVSIPIDGQGNAVVLAHSDPSIRFEPSRIMLAPDSFAIVGPPLEAAYAIGQR
jgi:maltooligosyltrehalose trehalohydrolase